MSELPDLPTDAIAPEPTSTIRTLADIVNRLLDRGVIVGGDIALSIAGVELAYVGLRGLITSASTARGLGLTVGPVSSGASPLPPVGTGAPLPPVDGAEAGAPAAGLGGRTAESGTNLASAPEFGTTGEGIPRVEGPGTEASSAGPALDDAVSALAHEVSRHLPKAVDISPEGVQRDLGRLVLTLVELIRRIVEHQAIRRMDDGDLDEERIERMGLALERLQATMHELRAVFGLAEEDLDIDLGPLGPLA